MVSWAKRGRLKKESSKKRENDLVFISN